MSKVRQCHVLSTKSFPRLKIIHFYLQKVLTKKSAKTSVHQKKKENKYTCYSLKITLPTIIAMIRCIHVSLTIIDFPYKYCKMFYKINEKSYYGKKKRFEITTWIIKRGAKTFFWTMAYFIKRIRTRTRTLKSENWTFSCQNSLYW